jgi:hypothetical protein
VIAEYDQLFTNPVTVNIDVSFGTTGHWHPVRRSWSVCLTHPETQMQAGAAADPVNAYLVAADASLPATDPLNGNQ